MNKLIQMFYEKNEMLLLQTKRKGFFGRKSAYYGKIEKISGHDGKTTDIVFYHVKTGDYINIAIEDIEIIYPADMAPIVKNYFGIKFMHAVKILYGFGDTIGADNFIYRNKAFKLDLTEDENHSTILGLMAYKYDLIFADKDALFDFFSCLIKFDPTISEASSDKKIGELTPKDIEQMHKYIGTHCLTCDRLDHMVYFIEQEEAPNELIFWQQTDN